MQTGSFRGFDVALHDGGIVRIEFNRVDHLNAMTPALKRDLLEVLTQAQMDDDVRVLIFVGKGSAFCAGDDISGHGNKDDAAAGLVPDAPPGFDQPMSTYAALRMYSQRLNLAIRELDKLTIAAVNGFAIQTGFSLALACDFRIASSAAKLGSATLRFGLLPDEGGHYLLIQHLGVGRAMDFLMRKKIVTAAEAHELGLVHEVVEPDRLESSAMALARELAEGPQAAMRMLKRSIYNAAELSFAQALEDIASKTAVTDYQRDAAEGVTAFREKRPAQFNRPVDYQRLRDFLMRDAGDVASE